MTSDAIIRIKIDANTGEARVIKRELDGIGKAGDRVESSSRRASDSVRGLGTAFKGLIAAIGIQQIIRVADQFTLLEARVKNSTRSLQEFEKSFKSLRDISAQTGASFQSAVEVFQRISFVREEINATAEEMVAFTGNVQKLGVVSGASTTELNAGLTQLAQGLSSGILRAEELNSILENTPSIAVSIADEFGVTTGQLRNLVLEGEVLSKDVFAAILNQTKDINSQFDQFPETVDRAFNNLVLQLQSSVSEMDELTGGTKILIEGIGIAGDVLEALVGLLQGFGNSLKAFFTLVIAGILDAFNQATRALEGTINLAIKGINLIKKEDIDLVSISSNIDRSSLAQTALQEARSEIQAAGQGFERAFESVSSIFTRQESVRRERVETRELSKNYAEIAENIKSADKETKETEKSTEKLADTVDKKLGGSVNDLTIEIERDFARAFKDAFTASENGFDRFIDGMKATFQNFIAEVAFQASKPIALNILGVATGGAVAGASSPALAALGGGASGGGGGLGGLLSGVGNLASGVSGFSPFLSDIGFGLGNAIGGGQTFLSAGFGNAGFGALGSLGANLLGLGGGVGGFAGGALGSIAGGGLGASAGTILGLAGGPVGAALGGFLGTALGGLFGGGGGRSTLGIGFSQNDQGRLTPLPVRTNNADPADAKKFQDALLDSLNKIADLTGGRFIASPSVQSTVGEGTFVGRNRVGGAGDFKGAVRGFLSRSDTFKIDDAQINQIFQDELSSGKSIEKVVESVVAARQIIDLINSFEDEATSGPKPLEQVLSGLNAQFENLKTKALELGLPVEKLAEAFEKQKSSIVQGALRPLQDFLDAQALSGSSTLSPVERLSLARSQFDETLSSIKGGDLSGINQITGQASQLLNLGREVFASGEGFGSLESFVRQSISGIAGDLGAPGGLNDSITREITLSNARQTSILEQVNAELQLLREENRKLRKSMERVGNAVVQGA